MPPSIVLEALKILEAEVNLREETRVAEQARPANPLEKHQQQADSLCDTQGKIHARLESVTDRIRALPDGGTEFAPEIELFQSVSSVMREAAQILERPDTGSEAIAAETEAIELLLQSKRINPKGGGGGGGSSPGGGGSGTTSDSAIALLGVGTNDKELREDHTVSQSTGELTRGLPEEFRAGLDEYFNRLERISTP